MYLFLLISLAIAGTLMAGPDAKPIDTQRSSITIHVGKAGLFAAAAHEHWVNAPVSSGEIDADGPTPSVRFNIDAHKLSVKAAKGVSEKDRAEIQENMQRKVLDSSAFPEIAFQFKDGRRVHDNTWRVSGDLTLHGVKRSVILDVAYENDAYVGVTRILQTDFGIQPIKIGGGVVKVKDELEIRFRVYTTLR